MNRTRLSLCYLAGYLLPTGLALMFAQLVWGCATSRSGRASASASSGIFPAAARCSSSGRRFAGEEIAAEMRRWMADPQAQR